MKIITLTVLIILSAVTILPAKDFELGLIFGSPAGLSAKLWNEGNTAFNFGLGWSNHDRGRFDNENRSHLHIDYHIHRFDLIPVDHGSLGLYYGIGGRIVTGSDTRLGARIPLGAGYYFAEIPFTVFLELVPVIDIIPEINISPDVGLGIRYTFGKRRAQPKPKPKGQLKKTSNKDEKDDEEENPKVKLQW